MAIFIVQLLSLLRGALCHWARSQYHQPKGRPASSAPAVRDKGRRGQRRAWGWHWLG